jgi:ATP-dependent Clp protease ATP-binding subunit ClpB
MTSNMGAETILENFEDLNELGDKHRADIIETTKVEVFEMLKDNLRPEFLNRIDDKIMFLPLTKEEIKLIASLLLKKVKKNLAGRNIGIELDDAAMSLLADLGYDPQFGARPLKRVIEKELVNELSKLVLSGKLSDGDLVKVGSDNKGLTFNVIEGVVEIN